VVGDPEGSAELL